MQASELETTPVAPTVGTLYRAVWRWHFYAGLVVLPVLLWLAITGGLYLYKPEIEALVYRSWSQVEPQAAAMPLDALVAAVERTSGNEVVQLSQPADARASWRMTLADDAGERRLAFVDPYRGEVLGTTGAGGVMQTVRSLHSLVIAGPIGNAVVEIVAGWAILLVLTGLYLWWPRRGSPVVGARGRPTGRLFWRDLHASIGLIAGGVILFLALTGMPWTGVAGSGLQSWIASAGLGRPKAPGPNPWAEPKGHDHGQAARATLPWSMQHAEHPAVPGAGDIGPSRAAAIAAARGLNAPWTMTMPATADAPYLLSRTAVRAQDAHVVYIDPATGAVLQDAMSAQFGTAARMIEWGIATHQGQQYGEANRLLMLGGCLSIVLLCVTAPVMWWKRRRAGGLSAPPRVADRRVARGVAAIMAVVGVILPLTGASIVAVLAGDIAWSRLRRARQ